jgi:hypothetical protein
VSGTEARRQADAEARRAEDERLLMAWGEHPLHPPTAELMRARELAQRQANQPRVIAAH